MSPVGLTKDQGWEMGLRRTLPIGTGEAWVVLTTQPGLGYWLGHGVTPPFKKGQRYQTDEGTTGDIRSYEEGRLMRMRWQPAGWAEATTLQIRVTPAKTGATISIHQERLASAEQREAMLAHWAGVMEQLERLVTAG